MRQQLGLVAPAHKAFGQSWIARKYIDRKDLMRCCHLVSRYNKYTGKAGRQALCTYCRGRTNNTAKPSHCLLLQERAPPTAARRQLPARSARTTKKLVEVVSSSDSETDASSGGASNSTDS